MPKCAPIKARVHRSTEGKLKSITLSRTVTGKYYASLLIEDGVDAPEALTHLDYDKIIGLDVGLTHLIVDSKARKKTTRDF